MNDQTLGWAYNSRRLLLSWLAEVVLRCASTLLRLFETKRQPTQEHLIEQSTHPEEIDPTDPANIAEPWHYYQLLRDERPVFKPKGQNFFCISRYEDIQEVARNTSGFSSNIVDEVLDPRLAKLIGHQPPPPGAASQRNVGVTPVDVLAVQDPPAHKYQKLLTHQIVSKDFVANLEDDVRLLAKELLRAGIEQDHMEFMADVAWKLPMTMAMRLVAFPESDYQRVKKGCSQAVRILSGTLTRSEYAACSAEALRFYRYCWSQFEKTKQSPGQDIAGGLAKAVLDAEHPMTNEEAVSTIFQLLIAGSDSSASTMGNAVKYLCEMPELATELRNQPEKISAFIEEIFRLESAFQGHFRVLTEDVKMHGISMQKGNRAFLLWASGNRDERFWEQPNEVDLERKNLKRHLTFGFGLHACLGRELARMEIRVVLEELLANTIALSVNGETPHVSSLFARTLVQLPLKIEQTVMDRAA